MVPECTPLQKDASLPGVGSLKWVKIMLTGECFFMVEGEGSEEG